MESLTLCYANVQLSNKEIIEAITMYSYPRKKKKANHYVSERRLCSMLLISFQNINFWLVVLKPQHVNFKAPCHVKRNERYSKSEAGHVKDCSYN